MLVPTFRDLFLAHLFLEDLCVQQLLLAGPRLLVVHVIWDVLTHQHLALLWITLWDVNNSQETRIWSAWSVQNAALPKAWQEDAWQCHISTSPWGLLPYQVYMLCWSMLTNARYTGHSSLYAHWTLSHVGQHTHPMVRTSTENALAASRLLQVQLSTSSPTPCSIHTTTMPYLCQERRFCPCHVHVSGPPMALATCWQRLNRPFYPLYVEVARPWDGDELVG